MRSLLLGGVFTNVPIGFDFAAVKHHLLGSFGHQERSRLFPRVALYGFHKRVPFKEICQVLVLAGTVRDPAHGRVYHPCRIPIKFKRGILNGCLVLDVHKILRRTFGNKKKLNVTLFLKGFQQFLRVTTWRVKHQSILFLIGSHGCCSNRLGSGNDNNKL